MFKPFSNFLTDRSKAVLLLWILFFCYLCFVSYCHVCSLQPCCHLLGKCWPLWCFPVFLSLSHMVCWIKCGIWLYRFPIFAFSLIFYAFTSAGPRWWCWNPRVLTTPRGLADVSVSENHVRLLLLHKVILSIEIVEDCFEKFILRYLYWRTKA